MQDRPMHGDSSQTLVDSRYEPLLLYRYVITYRYPFGKIVGMDVLSPTECEDYYARHPSEPPFEYDKKLIDRRRAASKRMRKRFMELGGVPKAAEPHYFTLGSSDEFFYGVLGYGGSFAIPLNEFDSNTVSFTLGDSVPIFDSQPWDEAPLSNRLYTLKDLDELLAKHHESVKDGSAPPFIEAQVWSDDVANAYSPHITVESVEAATIQADRMSRAILLAGPKFSRAGALPGVSLDELLKVTRGSAFLRGLVRHVDRRLYLPNPVHGFAHCFNTALYATYMANEQLLSEEETQAAILGALYHDVGRAENGKDTEHGEASAAILPKLVAEAGPSVLAMAQVAAHAHCMPLSSVGDIMQRYVPKGLLASAKRVATIVRTADSLDYIRLGTASYNPAFIEPSQHVDLIRPALGLLIMRLWSPEMFESIVQSYEQP